MPTPNAMGVDDNFGSGGTGLAPDGASGGTSTTPQPENLRDLLRAILGSLWAGGYANATALTASLAVNRAAGQLVVKQDDFSVWIWKPLDATAADATHIAPTDVGVGAGRWVEVVAATSDGAAPQFVKGSTTLVAGVSPAVSVPGLASTSKILVSRRDKNASTALGLAAVLTADIVTGVSGSFKIRTLAAADGTAVTADVSTFDWLVAL